MNNLMALVNSKENYTGARICGIPDLPNVKKLFPRLVNKTATYLVSHHLRALTIQNFHSDYPIVLFVDIHNENILGIFYEESKVTHRYGLSGIEFDLSAEAAPITTKSLLEGLSNGLLPNLSDSLTDRLLEAIIYYSQGVSTGDVTEIVAFIMQAEHKSFEFMYPRANDDVGGILKDLFKRYGVTSGVPSDLYHSQDKTWVYKGRCKKNPNNFIEVEVRQAQRSVDKGFEFKVIDPGFKRRVLDADNIRYNKM